MRWRRGALGRSSKTFYSDNRGTTADLCLLGSRIFKAARVARVAKVAKVDRAANKGATKSAADATAGADAGATVTTGTATATPAAWVRALAGWD